MNGVGDSEDIWRIQTQCGEFEGLNADVLFIWETVFGMAIESPAPA
jgi:hypothetical protein